MNKLVTIFLFILTVNSVKAQYTGGDNDGYSDGILTQSACSDLTPNFIYYGGNEDGYSDGTLTQSTCSDLTPNFAYYGGNNDGYSDGTLTQSTCPDLTPNFTYYGGINDGFGWHYTQPQICTTPLPIELLEFVGTCESGGIKLNWSNSFVGIIIRTLDKDIKQVSMK